MTKKRATTDDVSELVTLDEAAKLRGVTRAAISYLVQKKRIRSTTLFNRILVYRDEVLKYQPDRGGRPSTKKSKGKKASKK